MIVAPPAAPPSRSNTSAWYVPFGDVTTCLAVFSGRKKIKPQNKRNAVSNMDRAEIKISAHFGFPYTTVSVILQMI